MGEEVSITAGDRARWRLLAGREPPDDWDNQKSDLAEPDLLAAFFEAFPGAVTAYSIAIAAFALAMVLLRVAAHIYFGI